MAENPRYDPLERGPLFSDSMSARPVIQGTVPRTHDVYGRQGAYVNAGTGAATGADTSQLVTSFPFPVTEQVLARGQQEFNIHCSPCHGRAGYGRGIITLRGLRNPPSFHTDRLREAPVGHFYDVITSGYGAMYSYAGRVAPADRWAIIGYVRALQLSQHASPADVPDDVRGEAGFLLDPAPDELPTEQGGDMREGIPPTEPLRGVEGRRPGTQ